MWISVILSKNLWTGYNTGITISHFDHTKDALNIKYNKNFRIYRDIRENFMNTD